MKDLIRQSGKKRLVKSQTFLFKLETVEIMDAGLLITVS